MIAERETKQRQAIRKAIEETGRPLSPQEILIYSQDYCSGLGIATVYRNLKVLIDEGWLVSVELPGEPMRYEKAGKEHHHHFHCERCGCVFEIHSCIGNLSALVPPTFVTHRHELVFYGWCEGCKKA